MSQSPPRDHGGGIEAARVLWGGAREAWIDLSTGINPVPYPVGTFTASDWTALPDQPAFDALCAAARAFWRVPEGVDILPAPGASALIASLPGLRPRGRVAIPAPTYNEHGAAFAAHGWDLVAGSLDQPGLGARVLVHPNNPDGRQWRGDEIPADDALTVIDESFCDVAPEASLIARAVRPGTLVLKSFGKFWGLAGLRLGFAIGHPETLAPLRERIGPWAVSGPALRIGTTALRDLDWAEETRARLARDATRLDAMATGAGWRCLGGTPLFRLYDTGSAEDAQGHLASHHILTRRFPYSATWLRLGLPGRAEDWARLERALS
ncbi:threonine-phosphate decarboxylase [Dinoroseobacter sp. S375]|uniref:threonine-phosphate decarboxylase n=1 Tax=Dinoroseobacter sp. S375 TaxID=3415136 RepID=UPI003C7A8F90